MRPSMTQSRHEHILAHVESFALELDLLIRKAVIELVELALARSIRDAGPAQGSASGKGARRPSQPPVVGKAAKGGRRTGAELEALTASLLKYIEKHPGSRMEQIARGLGIASRELNLPLSKLKAERRLKTKGQKRATAYFAR
jgi:hypothetical protein